MTDASSFDPSALLASLKVWNEAYRNGTPLVTDAVYDQSEAVLTELVRVHVDAPGHDGTLRPWMTEFLAFIKTVGAPVPANTPWTKARHTMPMGSLNKAKGMDPFSSWLTGCGAEVGRKTLFVSDKLDGISIGMYYVDGKLVQAITRGDGEEGEDITRNVVKMQGVVTRIPGFWGFIRGEITLLHTDWKAHFPEMDNPRNGAAGVAKRASGVGSEHLSVLQYRVILDAHRSTITPDLSTKYAEFTFLTKQGAYVPYHWTKTSLKGIETLYQRYIDVDRAARNYDLDGLVVEFDCAADRDALGTRNHRPRGAIAVKFPDETAETTLRDIRWQVGNSGRITPVALFDTVNLAGANISQASLHNLATIEKLLAPHSVNSLYVGDGIVVSRRNDVIPYVEKVTASGLGSGQATHALVAPTHCPECANPLRMAGEFLVCPNTLGCPAQRKGAIKVWLNKIGAKHWGNAVIDALFDAGLIGDASDLYTLTEDTIAETEMGGRKIGGNAKHMLDDLHSRTELPLHVFVGSLNIPLCSRSTIRTLVENGYTSLDSLFAGTVDDFSAVPGVGPTRAAALVAGLQSQGNLIGDLIGNGVSIEAPKTGIFSGKSFCLSGFRDADLVTAIENQGGSVKSNVGKTLHALIAKDPSATTGKPAKARKYGVQVLAPADVWAQLGGRP